MTIYKGMKKKVNLSGFVLCSLMQINLLERSLFESLTHNNIILLWCKALCIYSYKGGSWLNHNSKTSQDGVLEVTCNKESTCKFRQQQQQLLRYTLHAHMSVSLRDPHAWNFNLNLTNVHECVL